MSATWNIKREVMLNTIQFYAPHQNLVYLYLASIPPTLFLTSINVLHIPSHSPRWQPHCYDHYFYEVRSKNRNDIPQYRDILRVEFMRRHFIKCIILILRFHEATRMLFLNGSAFRFRWVRCQWGTAAAAAHGNRRPSDQESVCGRTDSRQETVFSII